MTNTVTPRRLGAMNAEPPERMTADAGVSAAVRELGSAAPHLRNAALWITTSGLPNEYRDALDDLVRDVQFAKAGTHLSTEGKWSRVDALTAAWRPKAEGIVNRLEAQVAKWENDLTAAARPPAPTADAALLEAQLGNARADAVMVLNQAKDESAIVARLSEMARGSDRALAYLILGTEWVATYFRGRGVNSAAIVWDHERGQVLAAVLTDRALAAHQRLPGIPHARRAALALRAGHSSFVHHNSEYFGGGA